MIEHTHAGPVRSAADLAAKREYLRERSVVDFALAAHAWPDRLEEVDAVWRARAAFVKASTCTTHGIPGSDAATLRRLIVRVSQFRPFVSRVRKRVADVVGGGGNCGLLAGWMGGSFRSGEAGRRS